MKIHSPFISLKPVSNKNIPKIMIVNAFILCFILVYLLIQKSDLLSRERELMLRFKLEMNLIKAQENDLRVHQNQLLQSVNDINKEINALVDSVFTTKNITDESSDVMIKQNTMNNLKKKVLEKTSLLSNEENLSQYNKDIFNLQSSILALSNLIKELKYTPNDNDYNLNRINPPLLLYAKDIQLINSWIGEPNLSFKLFYSTKRDGFRTNEFHYKCDYIKPTLIIAQIDSDILIGGYTKESWDGEGFKIDKNAFIFNLSNGQKFQIKGIYHAIYVGSQYFPVFGVADLYIMNVTSTSYYPTSYDVLPDNTQRSNTLTMNKNLFLVKEFQVYQVINSLA